MDCATGFFLALNTPKGQAEDRARAKGEQASMREEDRQEEAEEEAHEDRDYSEDRELKL